MERWTLPAGWEWSKLGDFVTVNYGKGLSVNQRRGGHVPVFGANGVVGYHDVALTRSPAIVVGRKGSAGAVNFSEMACWPIDTTFFVDEFSTSLSPQYLFHFLRSQPLVQLQQSAAIPGLNRDVLYGVEVPIPYPDDPARSLAEQRRIVARLEALLGEVRELRQIQAEIEADVGRLVEAVVAEVFDAKVMDGWPFEAALGDLVEINASLVDPTLPDYRDLPHINGEVIEEGTGRLLPYRTVAEDGMRSAKYLFSPGSVLYSKIRPYLRKTATVDFTGLCSADMYPLELKTDGVSAEFLKWALLSPHFTSYAVGESGRARMPKINRAGLLAYRLRYPSISEQDSITNLLRHVQLESSEIKDVEIEYHRLIEELEQSILAQAFRGEL